MKEKYITRNLQLVFLAQQQQPGGKGKSIHEELAATIAQHKKILEQYFCSIGIQKSIHREVSAITATRKNRMAYLPEFQQPQRDNGSTWLIFPETTAA
jgi:hypothetical protein